MLNHIILPSLKHSNIFVQCLKVYWVDFRECRVVCLGAKSLNFEDIYFIHLKVLREYNWFSPREKPSNGLSFWWLNRRRMVYRLLWKLFWANDCERRESFSKYVKMQIFDHPSSNVNGNIKSVDHVVAELELLPASCSVYLNWFLAWATNQEIPPSTNY